MNGIRDTNGNDVPTWINSWQSGEYWIPATTPLILALSKAMALYSSASSAPVGQTIWLKASNDSYVSAWQSDPNTPLEARSLHVQAWEEFQVIDAGEGYIALKANANGNYVSARNDTTNTPLQTIATSISVWERFRWIDLGGGAIALQADANGSYVSAWQGDPNTPLESRAAYIQAWESFQWGTV